MYAQTLPISNPDPKPSPPFDLSRSNPRPLPPQSAGFRSGLCSRAKRVSGSPGGTRIRVGSGGIRCGGVSEEKDDGFYMRRGVEVAKRGMGRTSPNPMVGCVIVKDGEIVGEGFHPKAGQPHAEVFALRAAGGLAEGATAYVTLEPCNHFGRTPPCSEALVKAKVKRVVVGIVDPNPLVSSRGVATLRGAGIDVTVGVEEEMCRKLNEAWIHHMLTGMPFVTLRYSLSLGGGISGNLGGGSTESGGYYSKLLQEHDAVILSSKSTRYHPFPVSKEPTASQPVVIARNTCSPLDPPAASRETETDTDTKVVFFAEKEAGVGSPQGVETVVLDRMTLTTILEDCESRGLCSVLLDCRGGVGDLIAILEGGEGKLVQKVVVEVLPVWGDCDEETSYGAGERLSFKSFESKTVGKSVILEGYFQ